VPLPKAKEIIKSYGLGFSDDVIDNMLNKIDNRNEGRINFHQFTEAFRPHSLLLDEYQYSVENSFRVSIDENLPKELDASTSEKWGMAPPEVNHALAGESKLHDWLITRFGNLRDGFRHLDDKKHGAISTEDLRMKLKGDQARIGFKDEEVTALVRWADGSGKGRVEWKDFAPNLDRETAVENEYFTRSRLIAPTRSFLRAKEAPRPATSPCVTRSSVAASNEDARRIPRVLGLVTGQAATGGGKRFHFPERAPTTKREGYLYGFSKGSSYVGAGFSKDAALSTRPKTGDPAYSSKRAVPTSLYQQRRVAEAAQVVQPKDGYLYGSHLHQQKVEKQHYQNALDAAALEHDYLQRKRQRDVNIFDKIMQRNETPAPENLSNLQVLQEPSKFLKAKRREMSMVHYQGTACFRSPPFRDTREAAAYNRQSVAPYVPKPCHVGACQC
jgi:Ca2+-binding EF-hand superfamily protein